MHRRHFLALCMGLILAPSLACAGSKNDTLAGKYHLLETPVKVAGEPAVVEFFSFYCPPCYAFANQYGIEQGIRKVLPAGKRMNKYHVAFLGPLGAELTQAWSVALVLGIEAKVEPLLFEAVQVSRSLKTREDIRAVFGRAGVDGAEYDRLLASEAVRAKTEEQHGLFREFGVTGTPAVFVNGRYRVDNRGFRGESVAQFREEFVAAVDALLKKGA